MIVSNSAYRFIIIQVQVAVAIISIIIRNAIDFFKANKAFMYPALLLLFSFRCVAQLVRSVRFAALWKSSYPRGVTLSTLPSLCKPRADSFLF